MRRFVLIPFLLLTWSGLAVADLQALVQGSPEETGYGDYLIEQGRTDPHHTLNDEKEYNFRGREYHDHDARALSALGKKYAEKTGTKLFALAIDKIMTGSPRLKWEGIVQLGYSRKEFRQRDADAAAEKINQAHRDRLLADAGQNGQQASHTPTETALPAEVTAPMTRYLDEQGVNGEQFVRDLVSGKFSSDDDMLRAMGISSEETAKLASAFGGDESKLLAASPGNEAQTNDSSTISTSDPQVSFSARESLISKAESSQNGGTSTSASASPFSSTEASAIERAVNAAHARTLGVVATKSSRTIFHVGHRMYRGFARYRAAAMN